MIDVAYAKILRKYWANLETSWNHLRSTPNSNQAKVDKVVNAR